MIKLCHSLIMVLLVGSCARGAARPIVIAGVARESTTGYPWRAGIASLYTDAAGQAEPLATAEIECGLFQLSVPEPGNYRIRVALIGLSAVQRRVLVDSVFPDTLEFVARHVPDITHNELLDAVMRPGECPSSAYGQAVSSVNAPATIFREISIKPYGRIELGVPFNQRDSLSRRIGPGLYQLPMGFADTRAILVSVDAANVVQGLIFIYVDGKDFNAARQAYIDDLGQPVDSMEIDLAGARMERVIWQDSATVFELIRRQHPDSLPEVFSALRNR